MNKLELRMYGLVPYNISPIQQAIQFGHAVVEYSQKCKKDNNFDQSKYNDWADNWKTFIILNGGTTNTKIVNDVPFGTLNQYKKILDENGIINASFHEPDLGDQLTAIVFIVDERVFNKEDYPDFENWVSIDYSKVDVNNISSYSDIINDLKQTNSPIYKEWVDFIGGEKNAFLKDFLKGFKLA